MEYRFIADVHLGRLARYLRLLGFDTVYRNDYKIEELTRIADVEQRILLSRTAALAKHGTQHYLLVTSEGPKQQLKQVVQSFTLKDHFLPFSRCIACNGLLEAVPKESILSLLEKNTSDYYHEFWQCNTCKRIYCKGSHYVRMLNTIQDIQNG
jgi:uncharacterized protein